LHLGHARLLDVLEHYRRDGLIFDVADDRKA